MRLNAIAASKEKISIASIRSLECPYLQQIELCNRIKGEDRHRLYTIFGISLSTKIELLSDIRGDWHRVYKIFTDSNELNHLLWCY